MDKSKLIIGLVLLVALAGGIFYFVGSGSEQMDATEIQYKEISVETGTFEVMVSARGAVKPIDRIEIKSKASGQIVELAVEQGDLVKKGELIARLDQKDEQSEVKQAEANVAIAKAELTQAQRSFDRREQLYESNLISEEERDEIELTLAVANGKMVQASTTLERSRERLAESVVRAPIDGVVLQKYVEEGQIIASGVNNVSGGTALADIADMRTVYVEAGIDEIDIGKIAVGQSALVQAEAYPDRRFTGKVVRISPEARIEQNVTLFDVIVEVTNMDNQLKSGMNASIEITIVRLTDVLLIPATALQSAGGSAGGLSGSGQGWAGGGGAGNRSGGGQGWAGSGNRAASGEKSQSREGKRRDENKNERTVLLKRDGEFVAHTIEIGRSSFKDVVVVSGLEAGDVLGIPMISRLKAENDRLQERIRSSRSFGSSSR